MTNMEDVFKDLERAGKTDVENLIQWMKASKLLESEKDEKVRKLFKEAGNQQRVELDEFKKIVAKLAEEQSRSLDQLSKQLAAEGPKVIDAALKGLHAFKDALKAGKF